MADGIVKWFNERKGYGFIEQDEGPDVFVHHTGINATGQEVALTATPSLQNGSYRPGKPLFDQQLEFLKRSGTEVVEKYKPHSLKPFRAQHDAHLFPLC